MSCSFGAAKAWNIPSTEGYSTLLIEYEILATQLLGRGVDESAISVGGDELAEAETIYLARLEDADEEARLSNSVVSDAEASEIDRKEEISAIASDLATARAQSRAPYAAPTVKASCRWQRCCWRLFCC